MYDQREEHARRTIAAGQDQLPVWRGQPATRRGYPVNAIAVVEDEVRELVRRRGLDPAAEPCAVRRVAAREIFNAVAGFGPLQKYLDAPTVEEIWINERLSYGFKRTRVTGFTN